jgi:hypothetical protein
MAGAPSRLERMEKRPVQSGVDAGTEGNQVPMQRMGVSGEPECEYDIESLRREQTLNETDQAERVRGFMRLRTRLNAYLSRYPDDPEDPQRPSTQA